MEKVITVVHYRGDDAYYINGEMIRIIFDNSATVIDTLIIMEELEGHTLTQIRYFEIKDDLEFRFPFLFKNIQENSFILHELQLGG